MNDFIKKQQELAQQRLGKVLLVNGKIELETLITQIIANTGEELKRLAKKERRDCETDIGGADIDENIGYNQALDTMKQHITSVTGVGDNK